jgi:hypothetical protein
LHRFAWGLFGCACAAACVAAAPRLSAQESKWVKTGVTGRLVYVPDAQGDRIPDFSMVGYGAGKRAIPDNVPAVIRIDPIAGDNTQHIQNAINAASAMPLQANGFRGAVELGPGQFNVNGRLSITTSGVVLRGSGNGDSLATNTHIVSQNRTDAPFASPAVGSASTPVINIAGSGSGISRGSQIQIIDKVVPVGAQSFRVASTSGLTVGGMVEIYRPSTAAWVAALGMDQMPAGSNWGTQNLNWHRTITRIEGNRVFFDAPITTALDVQFGGGTIRTFNAPNRIRNVGVENLRGQSLDAREETNEVRTPTFISFTNVVDGFARDLETRHFSYASVFTSEADGTQHITVERVNSRLPTGQVTGGRRYTFAMDAQLSLVQNTTADSGRHDYVTGSAVTGPIVFRNSVTTNSRADSGPHHRWGNGMLFDNIEINGNAINVQNRWTSGSGHGWAGANVVIWNSKANSFIVQNPPSAQSWLIGSTGTINAGDDHLPNYDGTGYYDSHGTRVVAGGKSSLYEAQLNDASDLREFHWGGGSGAWTNPLAWQQQATPNVYRISMRDYLYGDIDDFTLDSGAGSVDDTAIAPAWSNAIAAASSAPIAGFDRATATQNAAFTFQHTLDSGERVIHATLAMSLKQSGGTAANDFVQLLDMDASRRLSFSSLGWASQVNASTPFVGVIDLGSQLPLLQSGAVNAWVSDNTSVDWAIYTATVATPKVDPVGAAAYLDGGAVRVDSAVPAVGRLVNGGPAPSELTVGPAGKATVTGNFQQAANGALVFEISGSQPIQIGDLAITGQALLDGLASVRLVGGFAPAVGASFDVIVATGGLAGTTFDQAFAVDPATKSAWAFVYKSTGVAAQLLSLRNGDLNHDGLVNASDWQLYKSGAWTNLAGLTPAQAYDRGDMNNDGVNDIYDFGLFAQAYDQANGVGAFVRMTRGVPEPAASCLFVTVFGSWVMTLGRAKRRGAAASQRVCENESHY